MRKKGVEVMFQEYLQYLIIIPIFLVVVAVVIIVFKTGKRKLNRAKPLFIKINGVAKRILPALVLLSLNPVLKKSLKKKFL